MIDLKTVLAPFLIANPNPKIEGPKMESKHKKLTGYNDAQSTVLRYVHPTFNHEFDAHFKIGSNHYTDNTYGSVSIRAKTAKGMTPFFACFLSRAEINCVIEALQTARDTAFPPGSVPYANFKE
jgi:hypothetical protein